MNFPKIKLFLNKAQDIVITDILYIIPSFVRWFYHVKIVKDIFPFPLKNSKGKKAVLYQHGKTNVAKRAILILHGLHGHPGVMLHFAEMAQEVNLGPVFSLYVSYDMNDLDSHRSLIKLAMDKIENLLNDEKNSLHRVVMVGHSMGAIESAYRAFVNQDPRISSVISLAGKLKNVERDDDGLPKSLHASFTNIYEGIQALPDLPLYQIVGDKDWIVPLESALVRKNEGYYHIIKNGGHLNLLFHPEMYQKFPEFLRLSLSKGQQ